MTVWCVTSPSNPKALIEWYLGTDNLVSEGVVNRYTVQGSLQVLRSSLKINLNHTIHHGLEVYCRVSNIPTLPEVESPRAVLDVMGRYQHYVDCYY
jgi:hypothetical protein